jgi:hypothetical protein
MAKALKKQIKLQKQQYAHMNTQAQQDISQIN